MALTEAEWLAWQDDIIRRWVAASAAGQTPSVPHLAASSAYDLGLWSAPSDPSNYDWPASLIAASNFAQAMTYLVENGFIRGYPNSRVSGSAPLPVPVPPPTVAPAPLPPILPPLSTVQAIPVAPVIPVYVGGTSIMSYDPYSMYGQPTQAITPSGGYALLSKICAGMPGPLKPVCFALGAFGIGATVAWSRLPGWIQIALTSIGVAVGTDILIDTDGKGGDDTGIIPFGGGQASPIPGQAVIGTWTANGVKFYRLADGRIAVQNSRGRWKVWRPKKPIVMFAGGAGNLRTFLRADAALNGQAKRLKKALDRRAGPRRARSRPSGNAGGGGGTTITKVD